MARYTVGPVHRAMCDIYLPHPGPCTCGLDALKGQVTQLKRDLAEEERAYLAAHA